MGNCIANTHLQVECEELAFVATANTLNPWSDNRLVTTTIHIDNQKEQTILGNANALTKALTFECVVHEKFIIRTKQTVLERKPNKTYWINEMLSIESINLLCVEHLLQSNLKHEMFEHGSTYGRLAAFRHSSKFDMKTHHAAVAVRLVLVAREYLRREQQKKWSGNSQSNHFELTVITRLWWCGDRCSYGPRRFTRIGCHGRFSLGWLRDGGHQCCHRLC